MLFRSSADFKENPKIYQKRMEQISYWADGSSMGTSYYHLGLYPAGNAIMVERKKFGQKGARGKRQFSKR